MTSTTFRGEYILAAAWFHNGKKVTFYKFILISEFYNFAHVSFNVIMVVNEICHKSASINMKYNC